MRLAVPVLLLALGMALAGCSSEGQSSPGPSATTGLGAGPPAAAGPGNATAPTPVVVPLDWQGSLVVGAWACEFTVSGTCHWQPEGAFGQSHEFEVLPGNVTGGELQVTWTPATPMTQELVLDAGVYTPGCADCNHTMLGSVNGPSPLVIAMPDGLRLAAGEVLGIGVYSNQYTATDQAAAGTSGDQDFAVSGSITIG